MAEAKKWPWKDNDLRPITRVITDHDHNGKSVFSSEIPEELPGKNIGAPALFRLGYCTNESPVSMAGNSDLHTYANYLRNPPGIIIPGTSLNEPTICHPRLQRTLVLTLALLFFLGTQAALWPDM